MTDRKRCEDFEALPKQKFN